MKRNMFCVQTVSGSILYWCLKESWQYSWLGTCLHMCRGVAGGNQHVCCTIIHMHARTHARTHAHMLAHTSTQTHTCAHTDTQCILRSRFSAYQRPCIHACAHSTKTYTENTDNGRLLTCIPRHHHCIKDPSHTIGPCSHALSHTLKQGGFKAIHCSGASTVNSE